MHRFRLASVAVALLATAVGPAMAAGMPSGNACTGFRWDASHEVALFAATPTKIRAGANAATAPAMRTERLYEVKLSAQAHVRFAVPPGKLMLTGGDSAGILKLDIAAPGLYRVAVDRHFWIDAVAGKRLISTTDFSGSPNCGGPRKIVEFNLPRGPLLLQLSGYADQSVRLTVTRVPGRHSSRHK